jgi:hypothetical protein
VRGSLPGLSAERPAVRARLLRQSYHKRMYDRQMARRQRAPTPLSLDHQGIAYFKALCPSCSRRVEQFAQTDTGQPVIHRSTERQARRTYGHLAEKVGEINRSFAQMFPELTKVGFRREWFRTSTGLGIDPPQNTLAAAMATFPNHPETHIAGLRCTDEVWRGECHCGRTFAVPNARLKQLVADAIADQRGAFHLPAGPFSVRSSRSVRRRVRR